MPALVLSTGEYLDRMAILLVKSKCFFGAKRHECSKRFYSMERSLQIPPEKEESVSALFRELVDTHQSLFDAEDEVRLAANNMPIKEPGSTKGWFDASIEDDIVRLNLMKHCQASHSIRQLNTERHKLIAKIDAAIGEVSEPKQYAGVPEFKAR